MSKTFNESAFPVPGLQHDEDFNGMSLRDYLAAKAMQGICAHPDTWGLKVGGIGHKAYEIADAMLAARS